jgi:hypothetical protein
MSEAVKQAVECADARALNWLRGKPWTGWGIDGPSPWRDGVVPIDADAALAEGYIGVRHYTRRSLVYVTRKGRALLKAA